jgi:lysophospholipase L1-like esterase
VNRTRIHLSAVLAAILLCATVATRAQAPAASHPMMFAGDIKAFQDRDRVSPPPQDAILFIGSSIFRLWSNVQEQMAPLPVFNRAFGGARTWEVLNYIDRIVLPYRPRVIVFYTGSNDVTAGEPASAIVGRTREFIAKVHDALPLTRIYYVAINRSPDKRDRWSVVDAVNAEMRSLAGTTPHLRFLDLNPVLFDAKGEPRMELYLADGLHFHPPAYELFAAIVKPALVQGWKELVAGH